MSTDTNLKEAVSTVQVPQTKASASVIKQDQQEPVLQKVESKYKSEDYNGAPIVKLSLIKGGTMQYDSKFKLKLDSIEPTEMPLTPFFAERLNRTVLLSQ